MDIFYFNDYKKYILKRIEDNTHLKGYRSKLAEAAGCGRSFLSQVLNSEVQLTLDHGANLCEFWDLDDSRADYFLDLMAYDRAASKNLRQRLKDRIEERKEASRRLASRKTPVEELSSSLKEAVYYSSWHYAAIHVLTAIPNYQKVQAISKRLDLSTSLVEKTLRDLHSLGLVEECKDRWVVKGPSVFLRKESPISPINQGNWRTEGMKHLSQFPDSGMHLTGLYAISKSDAEKVLGYLSQAFENANKLAVDSEEEELFCLNMDFFTV